MYEKLIVGLDGSKNSDLAKDASLDLAKVYNNNPLICCHVYAADMHRSRFEDMEPGLPEKYHEKEQLNELRDTHEDIITDGMQLISDAYLHPIFEEAEKRNISYRGSTPEGHNYVEFLKVIEDEEADLVIMGACGHGDVGDGNIGSLTERTLLNASDSDLLVVRKPWNFKGRPIVVGIDGSENSYAALKRAIEISKIVDAPVEAVAVYDPYFHNDVFSTITRVLPDDAKERFDFEAQEKLHDEIIDKGLETIYKEGLERGVNLAKSMDAEIYTDVAKGKVYSQLYHHAALKGAALIVVGRWGLHQEDISIIGSNTMKLARLSQTNVLVVSKPEKSLDMPESSKTTQKTPIKWTSEAEAMIDQVPSFAQNMARKMVENSAIENNESTVTAKHVQEIGDALGMGNNKVNDQFRSKPTDQPKISNKSVVEGQVVVLKKIKRMAPDFHKHILKSKIQDKIINKGDKFMVYEVVETIPPETIRVTERTLLEFK